MGHEPILYGLKACDGCRKALKALPSLEFVDVRTQGLPDDVLDRALFTFGDRLLNNRSTTWRGLSAEERKQPVKVLLKAHPALMKRPLIVVNDRIYLSWNKDIGSEVKSIL